MCHMLMYFDNLIMISNRCLIKVQNFRVKKEYGYVSPLSKLKQGMRDKGFNDLFRQELGVQAPAATESSTAYALPAARPINNMQMNNMGYNTQYARPYQQQFPPRQNTMYNNMFG